jgi:hypothetical protein
MVFYFEFSSVWLIGLRAVGKCGVFKRSGKWKKKKKTRRSEKVVMLRK